MRPVRTLFLLLCLAGCAGERPAISRSGPLVTGGTLVVSNADGNVDAYAPERHSPQDQFLVQAFAPASDAVTIDAHRLLVRAIARRPGVRFLVRAPRGTAMDLNTTRGNISVADYDGIVNAHTADGNIKMLIPAYGNASTDKGNISVYFASDSWPGTLHFSTNNGNVEVYVNEHAKAHIRMHTGDGTVFSDFNITGTSHGTSEIIDAPINGGGPRSIDIEVKTGSIRVMQLRPQL